MSLPSFADLARGYAGRFPARFGLRLRLEELTLDVRSNSEAVADDLRGYFGNFVEAAPSDTSAPADLEFLLLEAPVQEPPVPLAVKPHAPGKRPDKERFVDLPGDLPGDLPVGISCEGGGRVVRKQATGMLFLFGQGANQAVNNAVDSAPNSAANIAVNIAANSAANIAIGPCAANRNQLVNFLCARYMERRLAAGWMLGHAAGVARPVAQGGKALALCGFAGMGKSTLALHLLARGLDFVSNDRVLVEPAGTDGGQGHGPVLHGIPKHPRLNPGTALGNPALAPFLALSLEKALPEAARSAYAGLSPERLRAVEDKFDANIDSCFGPIHACSGPVDSCSGPVDPCFGPGGKGSRFRLAAPLCGVVALNWTHGHGALVARRVDLRERRDLLEALRKPPGVFYLPQAIAGGARLTPEQCLEALDGVPALELSGGADFEAAASACEEFLGG